MAGGRVATADGRGLLIGGKESVGCQVAGAGSCLPQVEKVFHY